MLANYPLQNQNAMAIEKKRALYLSKQVTTNAHSTIPGKYPYNFPKHVLLEVFSNFDLNKTCLSKGLDLEPSWLSYVKQWKSLMLVCREWNDLATRMFYRSVFLYRPGQVEKLLSTLELTAARMYKAAASNEQLFVNLPERWIRNIYVRIPVSPSDGDRHCDDVVYPAMRVLLSRCQSVQSVVEVPSISSECPDEEYVNQIPFVFFLDDTVVLSPTLPLFWQLRSLTIWLGEDDFPEESIVFPALQSLSIIIRSHGLPSLSNFAANWYLPVLAELSIKLRAGTKAYDQATGVLGAPFADLSNIIYHLFRAWGAYIKSFTLDSGKVDVAISLFDLFRDGVVPNLEHLSYSYAHSQRLGTGKLQEDRLVLRSLRRITLLPSTVLSTYVARLPHLIGVFQDFRRSRMFPALNVVELSSPDPVGLPLITPHSTRWAFTVGSRSEDARHVRQQAELREIGRSMNDLVGDGKKVIIDSASIPYIALDEIFRPKRSYTQTREVSGFRRSIGCSRDEHVGHMIVPSPGEHPVRKDKDKDKDKDKEYRDQDMDLEAEITHLEAMFINFNC